MTIWDIANRARDAEGICAALAVRAMQRGKDCTYLMERAAQERAKAYEFEATGKIVSPLLRARIDEMRARRNAR